MGKKFSRLSASCLRNFAAIVVMGILLGSGGCAPVSKGLGTRFFPPAPDPPRIQFLQRISSSMDVEEQSKLQTFVTGEIQARKFGKPYGIAVNEGVIYVCDPFLRTVLVIDPARGTFDYIHDAGRSKLERPMNIAFDREGSLYVADIGRMQVVKFDKRFKFQREFGNKDQFKPTAVAVSGNKLYVADNQDHQIEVLDKETGELLQIIGEPGGEEGQFYHPTNLAVDKEGNLYVTDAFNTRVQKFDPEGQFLAIYGERGDTVGTFARPKGLTAADDGLVFVVDSAFENVQIFTPEGEPALAFGGFGGDKVPGALWLPAGITIDKSLLDYYEPRIHKNFQAEYLILVVSQFGPAYVNIYAFGEAKEGTDMATGEYDEPYMAGQEEGEKTDVLPKGGGGASSR